VGATAAGAASLPPAYFVVDSACRRAVTHPIPDFPSQFRKSRNDPEEVHFANLYPAMPEDVVCRRVMKIEIRQREMQHVIGTLHGDLARTHREGDVLFRM